MDRRVLTPAQREYCRQRFLAYWGEQAAFRALTEREYAGPTYPVDYPADSVRSARIDGMPQAKVAWGSDPTARTVMQRLEIAARVAAQSATLGERLDWLQDRMATMAVIWATLDDRDRLFVQRRYWDGLTSEDVAGAFLTDDPPTGGPTSRSAVYRYEDDLLTRVAGVWLAPDGTWPADPPPFEATGPDPWQVRRSNR